MNLVEKQMLSLHKDNISDTHKEIIGFLLKLDPLSFIKNGSFDTELFNKKRDLVLKIPQQYLADAHDKLKKKSMVEHEIGKIYCGCEKTDFTYDEIIREEKQLLTRYEPFVSDIQKQLQFDEECIFPPVLFTSFDQLGLSYLISLERDNHPEATLPNGQKAYFFISTAHFDFCDGVLKKKKELLLKNYGKPIVTTTWQPILRPEDLHLKKDEPEGWRKPVFAQMDIEVDSLGKDELSERRKVEIDALCIIKMVDCYRAAGFSIEEIGVRINDPVGILLAVFEKMGVSEKEKFMLTSLLNDLALANVKKQKKAGNELARRVMFELENLPVKKDPLNMNFMKNLVTTGEYDPKYLKKQPPIFERFERLQSLVFIINDHYKKAVSKIDALSFRHMKYQSMGMQIDLSTKGKIYPEVGGGGGDFAGRYGGEPEEFYFSGGAIGLDRTLLVMAASQSPRC